MKDEFIDYASLVDEAMHLIVKKSLQIILDSPFIGEHHFFISFMTNHTDVIISQKLKNKYPEEMTIVLQYQFEKLIVKEDYFSVVLSFDNIKETIKVPYQALTAFADPSVKFGLQFKHYEDLFGADDESEEGEKVEGEEKIAPEPVKIKDNVVDLANFRKNKE